MKKLFYLLLFIPFITNAQIEVSPDTTIRPSKTTTTRLNIKDNNLVLTPKLGNTIKIPSIINGISEFNTYSQPLAIYDGSIWVRTSGTVTSVTSGYGYVLSMSIGGIYYKRVIDTYINVKWFGAKGDGITEDSYAFQRALNYAFYSKIKAVIVPKAYYLIGHNFQIPIGVTLEGLPSKPTYKSVNNADIDSPTLVIKTPQNVDSVAVTILYNATIANFTFNWPLQLKTNTTPIPYGWAISTNGQNSNGDGILIKNIMLTNCYNGINIEYGGQWDIENVKGQTCNIGINLDRVYDVSRITNIHFWDFWAGSNDAITPYVRNNGVIFKIGRVDGLQITNVFGWGHKNLFYFYYANHDNVNVLESGSAWVQLTNIKSDLNKQPIFIDRANIIQIENLNGTSLNTADGSNFIETGVDIAGDVELSNVHVFHTNALLNIKSSTGTFKLTNTTSENRGDANDGFGYKIINQSTAKVTVDEADYNQVSGNIQIGNNIRWSADTNITSSVTNFTNLANWSIVSNRVSSITNGYRFNLVGNPMDVQRFILPSDISNGAGVYVFECDMLLNNPNNLGVGAFYARIGDAIVNDVLFPSKTNNNFYVNKTHIKVPFILRTTNLAFDFVFGNASSTCTMDITNMKISKMLYPSKTTIDWLQSNQPNSLKLSLPSILTDNPSGSITLSGSSSTTYNIPHGLGTVPSFYQVQANTSAAAGAYYVTADATNIIVNYITAPTTGTNNLIYKYVYKK